MRYDNWTDYVPIAVGAAAYAAARTGDLGHIVRTLCRTAAMLLLSAFRVPTADIVRRLEAIGDDGPATTREGGGRTAGPRWRVSSVREDVRPPPRPRRTRRRRPG